MAEDLRILYVVPSISETSSPYNEQALPIALSGTADVSICTFYMAEIAVPKSIRLYDGNNTVRGFLKQLSKAKQESEKLDVIHTHSPQVAVLLLLARLWFFWRDITLVHTVHSSYANYKLRNRLFLVLVFLMFDEVVMVSYASLDSFPRWFRSLAVRRLSVIPNGIDLSRIDAAVESKIVTKSERFRVIVVGRLIPIKQPIQILLSFQALNSQTAELVFVGDGEYKSILEETIRANDLSNRVQLRGVIPRDQVYNEMRAAHVFVSFSTVEGLPIAVLEAMATRCQIILSDIPPHREIAKDTSIPLISPNDTRGLTSTIQHIMYRTVEEQQLAGSMHRQIVEERYGLEHMVKAYLKLYERR